MNGSEFNAMNGLYERFTLDRHLAEIDEAEDEAERSLAQEGKIKMVFNCGPSSEKCKCECPDGLCEHQWDGPPHYEKNMGTATCSRCGMWAINHDIWVMP